MTEPVPAMQYRTLGRTGLRVSVASLGSGGSRRLGQATGAGEREIVALIHHALDLGINFIDTSPAYQDSEALIGSALQGGHRARALLCTKFAPSHNGRLVDPATIRGSVEESLRRLRTDSVDVLLFHGLLPEHFDEAVERQLPTVLRLRDEGKCRFIGVSEAPPADTRRQMLPMAIANGSFDVIMVGYNLLMPGAELEIIPAASRARIGIIAMTAVRRALSDPAHLLVKLDDAIARGVVASDAVARVGPLDWLLSPEVPTIPAAGYKFAAAQSAVATVLVGTSNALHLDDDVRAILGPSLRSDRMARIRQAFGHVLEPLAE